MSPVEARLHGETRLDLVSSEHIVLPFDAVDFDDGFFDGDARFVASDKLSGTCLIGARVQLMNMQAGSFGELFIRVNGKALIASENVYMSEAGGPTLNVSTIYELVSGDYVEVVVYHDNLVDTWTASRTFWISCN